jgi:hypothetical protein
MPEREPPIDVKRSTLGGALRDGPLRVPDFQREYSWKKPRVAKLFADFANAMVKEQSSYFLGSVVVTPGDPPAVVDGQQRLATTCIFLAAVRDAMIELGEAGEASTIYGDFLFKYDRSIREDAPRLLLNTDDRICMRQAILDDPEKRAGFEPRLHSHRLILQAAEIAAERVRKIVDSADTIPRKVDALNAWVRFIDEKALIVMLTPPNAGRAYQIFKTSNDRGQRTSQVDMIKSHLLEQSEPDAAEGQVKWSTMRSTIAGLSPDTLDDPLLGYLHNVSIVLNGPVRADDIFEVMENTITGKTTALAFLDSLAKYANDYAAIATPTDGKWGAYDQRLKIYVGNISQEVKMTFIRPLMLAVAAKFTKQEALLAFRAFNSWVVRFLIAGGSRSGVVEKAIGDASREISSGTIKTARALIEKVRHVIPNDVKFASAFKTKTISQARQARFLLVELEAQRRGGSADALMAPVRDTSLLTLEHILPKNLEAKSGWSHFSDDERRTYRARLGNLCLLENKDNGAIGDKPFKDKRPVVAKSQNILLTKDVIDHTDSKSVWTAQDIDARQVRLADLAIDRWPIEP